MATQTKNWFTRVWQRIAFFGAFVIFAMIGALISVVCIVPALLFRGNRARVFGQRLIHRLFRIFMSYVQVTGLVELDAGKLSELRGSHGVIIVANHPCLFDAVLMVSQIPQAVCLMKGSLAHNIIFSNTARLAGYIHNESRLGLVKKCEERLQEGANLLIFPEGTRSVDGRLLPFKKGFALAAVLTGSPVQTVIITSESDCLRKGSPLLKMADFPMRYSLSLGQRFQPGIEEDARSFGRRVENYFRETLHPSEANQVAEIQSK